MKPPSSPTVALVAIAALAAAWAPGAASAAEVSGPTAPVLVPAPAAVPRLEPLGSLDGPAPVSALRPLASLRRAAARLGMLDGTGELRTVSGSGRRTGSGRARRYAVEVEGGLPVDRRAFAAEVERTLGDPRGWTRGGDIAFRRVSSRRAGFRVTLASRATTDRLCAPHETHGRFSCFRGGHAVLNVWRWLGGARSYGHDLAGYRRYLVNHEVGHAIGHAEHLSCPRAGAPAPVMMQQTRGVRPCAASPWPTDAERARVAP